MYAHRKDVGLCPDQTSQLMRIRTWGTSSCFFYLNIEHGYTKLVTCSQLMGNNHCVFNNPSINTLRTLWGTWEAEANPSWHWAGGAVHPGPVAYRDKQPVTVTFTPTDKLESPIYPIPISMWEEARVPEENTQSHRENIQTAHRKILA